MSGAVELALLEVDRFLLGLMVTQISGVRRLQGSERGKHRGGRSNESGAVDLFYALELASQADGSNERHGLAASDQSFDDCLIVTNGGRRVIVRGLTDMVAISLDEFHALPGPVIRGLRSRLICAAFRYNGRIGYLVDLNRLAEVDAAT